MAGSDNLKPFTRETARAMGSKGGKASGESRRRKANLRKAANDILANRTLKVDGESLTAEEAIVLAMLKKAVEGDVGAYKALIATVGLGSSPELDEREQRARIKKLEAEAKIQEFRAKAIEEHASGEGEAMEDDGFLEALRAAAAEDWADEGE
jgi:hypothetical protein